VSGSGRISPTAYYTGHVWVRAGLSDPAVATRRGAMLHAALAPALTLAAPLAGAALDDVLYARHTLIDEVLEEAISRGEIGQIVEIAAGFSGRGVRFAKRHAITYVEADLPHMAKAKREMLAHAGLLSLRHRVVDVDVLAPHGPLSIAASIGPCLDPAKGTAVVTEGLLSYFPREAVDTLWSNVVSLLRAGAGGLYVAETYLTGEHDTMASSRAFRKLLGVFVRGRTHLHFATSDEVKTALLASGFDAASVRNPPGRALVSVLEGRVNRP
jgi:O-methyltransferase involved in polyketide biosynthesis